MTLTGKKTLPMLMETLAQPGAWGAFYARQGFRIYPYQIGCMVRANSSNGTVLTFGLGQFAQNDYVLPCRAVDYGGSPYFTPDTSRITRVTSDPLTAVDDTLVTSPAKALVAGEHLMCLGTDGAATPLANPNYDGSAIVLYDDNVGQTTHAYKYLLTGQHGMFRGWVSEGYSVVDLLITDSSGNPLLVLPFVAVGPEVV